MKLKHILILSILFTTTANGFAAEDAPAEIAIGERLFLETRFAQAWYAKPGSADPALKETITTGKSLKGSFAGSTMNCRACHMVDEHQNELGMRTYADYAINSPIPNRNDGKYLTGRNSMSLVNISKSDVDNILFHFDGEFNSLEDLVVGTFTGRNFGWQATEKDTAIKHIANIIRSDNGKGALASEFGGSYRKILKGTDSSLAKEFQLPAEYRIDVDAASDEEILGAVAKLVTAYSNDLSFSVDSNGFYNGSPYDTFLSINKLPRSPKKNETSLAYGQRLLKELNKLTKPTFVSASHGEFETHKQAFIFAEKELKGLKLFLRSGSTTQSGGNCASCHQAPHFTDFRFHNTGISQNQYDLLHGTGSFSKIDIPSLAKRNKNAQRYLPASEKQPNAKSIFRSPASKQKIGYTDLGLWNITANPEIPSPQKKIRAILCQGNEKNCTDDSMLTKSIAAFKTPSIRDAGHSAPYMHTGELNTLTEVLTMYVKNSALARQGKVLNANDDMKKIRLSGNDIEHLVDFIKSLNEDYD